VAGVQRIVRGEPLPPAHRARGVPLLRRTARESAERLLVVVRERAPLHLGPALEVGRRREVEAVEERALVETRRTLPRPVAERRLELADVRLDHPAVEPEVLEAEEDLLAPEVAPERVDGLGQQAPRPVLVRVRPEDGDDLLARDAALAGAREQREDREPARLRRSADDRSAVGGEGQAA
jgi:hypothetical protein